MCTTKEDVLEFFEPMGIMELPEELIPSSWEEWDSPQKTSPPYIAIKASTFPFGKVNFL